MVDVAHEAELLKEYKYYLFRHTNAFYKRACLPKYMLEDVYQEACLAFLLYLREEPGAEDALRRGQFIIPTSRIRFHLYRQFVDSAGIGLKAWSYRSFIKNHKLPFSMDSQEILDKTSGDEYQGDPSTFWMDDADTLKAVYMREWLHSMTPQDQKITILFMSGYNGREVAERMNMKQPTVNLHWRNCQKTYYDYVDVA